VRVSRRVRGESLALPIVDPSTQTIMGYTADLASLRRKTRIQHPSTCWYR
jgi:hypothetical protein